MKYNFDKVIDRSGTSAEKVEGLEHIWGRTDLIPLWVADMDFAIMCLMRKTRQQ